jgi:hypothetical protein
MSSPGGHVDWSGWHVLRLLTVCALADDARPLIA